MLTNLTSEGNLFYQVQQFKINGRHRDCIQITHEGSTPGQ